jgi:hypothetical protein
VLAIDGEDVRDLPLSMRKVNLERLLRGRPDGIFINPFEIGAIGPDLFRAACDMGLEGLVSKHRDRPYRGGRSPHPDIGADTKPEEGSRRCTRNCTKFKISDRLFSLRLSKIYDAVCWAGRRFNWGPLPWVI